ncbi:MAG: hypothetical protein Q4D90_07135, partial [bacterium]|nr:hypothetical protein [bacterium]
MRKRQNRAKSTGKGVLLGATVLAVLLAAGCKQAGQANSNQQIEEGSSQTEESSQLEESSSQTE